jgi:endonuclease I
MKVLVILVSFLSAVSASAAGSSACHKAFGHLQNKQLVGLKPYRETTVKDEKQLKRMRDIEEHAVLDYKKYVMPQIPEWGLELSTRQYFSKENGESLGYRVEVNGGDEAVATFYYRIDIGMEDIAYQLLYYSWDNQSPVKEWVCEGHR